jgi:outer membrane receptor protein involved in Fe transport
MIFSIGVAIGQNDESKPEKKKERPVRSMFESSVLIDDQTSVIPIKNTLVMHIQHRFGLIKTNSASDLFGIYAPSANTRMGLNYSILNNLMVGYGITKKNMYNDFQVKWAFLRQTRSGNIPLNLAVYANMAIDGRKNSVFGDDYEFANRLSYFTQLIVGRKFNEWFSMEVNVSYTHFNAVPTEKINVTGYEHSVFGAGGHVRFKFSAQSSIVLLYSAPIFIEGMAENTDVLNDWSPNVGIGYEVATSTHAFQIFVTTADGIVPQDIYMYNTSKLGESEIRFGFNITRLWGF